MIDLQSENNKGNIRLRHKDKRKHKYTPDFITFLRHHIAQIENQ